jgi:hypothetical protein
LNLLLSPVALPAENPPIPQVSISNVTNLWACRAGGGNADQVKLAERFVDRRH